MDFKDKLIDCAKRVDKALEERLRQNPSPSQRLLEAELYGTIGSGKKLRPWLALESSRICGASEDMAMQCALAVETVHAYSLIHDDLPAMDDDDMRRGKPTTHIAFDQATAILAGDSLLTLAFEILSEAKTHPQADVRVMLISELARASGSAGMVAGQMLDLSASGDEFDLEKIIEMQSLKTGKLITFSACVGSLLVGAPENIKARFTRYGEAIGLAFQITDDLLDAEGCETKTGKRAGKDKAKGKATFIDCLGLEGARDKATSLVKEAKMALEVFGGEADGLRQTADYILDRDN